MEISITGNPGEGNRYNDVRMSQVGSYNPNATESKTYINYENPVTRLASWFRKLKDEFEHDVKLQKKLDDIRRYRTKLPHTIGVERKLRDGGFSKQQIEKARRLKLYYAKKATRFQYYESAQRIDSYLFAIVSNRFDRYVMPLIEDGRPLRSINQAVYEQVVLHVMAELNTQGADDTCLCYNEDDILGMVYYLTGNCHINWTTYDV